jgi:DNA-binding CsgD family transcriptional regulator
MSRAFSLFGVCTGALPATALLVPGKQVLGRSSMCDIKLKDKSVSRRHAEIVVTESGVSVTDLGSCNGTFVEGWRILTSEITNGQSIRFGKVTFVLAVEQAANGEPHSEDATDKQGDAPPLAQEDAADLGLSPTQRRVFKLLVDGFGEKQIAARLKLSQHTVHNHVRAIYTSYSVHSRAELLARLLQLHRDGALRPA